MVVALAVAVVPAIFGSSATADPIDDQRAEVERITDQLEELERQSDVLSEQYVQAIDKKQQLDAEVAEAEKRVAAKEAQVAKLRGELGEVAVRAFIGAGSNGLAPIFTDSSEFTDDLQRDQLSRIAVSAGTATTDELDQAVADLNDEQAALEDKRDQAAELTEEIADAKEATESQHAEYQEARSDAEAKLGRLIQEEEERRARESFLRMQREAEEAAAAAAAQQAAEQQAAAPPADDGSSDDGGGGGGGDAPVVAPDPAPEPSPEPSPEPAPEPTPEPAPEPPSVPPASSRAGTAVNAAMSQLGVAYEFAAATPGVAFDCSGLTMWAWAQAGVGLPHQSSAQYNSVAHVPSSAAQPGDLIFYYSPISHVGLYIGGGQMVHASMPGVGVVVSSVNWGNVVGVGRPG
jgi:cell wall-associated NlpC family hydrolase